MQRFHKILKSDSIWKIGIILSVATILVVMQATWVLDNYHNNLEWAHPEKYYRFFDTMLFRVSAALLVGLIVGAFTVFVLNKKFSRDFNTKLSVVLSPSCLFWIYLFRDESNLSFVTHQLLPFIILILIYLLAEIYFLIPKTASHSNGKFKPLILPVLFLSLTLSYFVPFQTFLTNPNEFYFIIYKLPFYLIPGTAILFLVICRLLLLLPLKEDAFKKTVGFIFAAGLGFWIQTNVLNWNYGILDGTKIDWVGKWYLGLIDFTVWLALLAGVIVLKADVVFKIARNGSVFLILLQLVSSALFLVQHPQKDMQKQPSFRRLTIDDSRKYVFSSNTNVIILILDEFQGDIFKDILAKDTNYAAKFPGFVYYPNTTANFTCTTASVPAILTEVPYDNKVPLQEYSEKTFLNHSILKTLRENQFETDVYPWAENPAIYFDSRIISNIKNRDSLSELVKELFYLYDVALFKEVPHFVKQFVYNNSQWLLYRNVKDVDFKVMREKNKWNYDLKLSRKLISYDGNVRFFYHMAVEAEKESNKGCFKFYHVSGMHIPITTLDNLEVGDFSYNRTNYLKSAEGMIKLTTIFIKRLQELNIYDNTLLFVLGDHGSGRTPDMQFSKHYDKTDKSLYNNTSFQFFQARGVPLLLVKPLHSKGPIRISQAPAELSDIPMTIASELGLSNDFKGRYLLKIGENEKRQRYYQAYDFWDQPNDYYLGEMREYVISGNSWLGSSWKLTGRTFKPASNKKN